MRRLVACVPVPNARPAAMHNLIAYLPATATAEFRGKRVLFHSRHRVPCGVSIIVGGGVALTSGARVRELH
jgi:hypothetical protein